MVALLLSWQLLFDHLRKSQDPNTSFRDPNTSPWFPRLLLQRLWSDSISNVLLLHKHSWEQCTSLNIQSRKSVSCQKSSPIILTRHLPSAVYSSGLKFLLHKFKHVCFPLRQSPLVICAAVCSFGEQPSHLQSVSGPPAPCLSGTGRQIQCLCLRL